MTPNFSQMCNLLHRPLRAWIVFKDGDEKYLRWMRPGFRHLFIHGLTAQNWFTIEVGMGGLDVEIVPRTTISGVADIKFIQQTQFEEVEAVRRFWQSKGWRFVEVRPAYFGKRSPLGLLSCVGFAKKFVGLRRPWILTPWQLYKFLVNNVSL